MKEGRAPRIEDREEASMRIFRSHEFSRPDELRRRVGWDFWSEEGPLEEVRAIIERVRKEGDSALLEYSRTLDGVDLSTRGLRVSEEELARSRSSVEPEFMDALKAAVRSITAFHRRQSWEPDFWDSQEGARIGQVVRPLRRVGIYVPGGRASYPSTAMMTVIPAKIAGVGEIAVCVPPAKDGEVNPYTLATLNHLGVKEVYRIGGAQAIAAMALGTESVPAVDKVFGPGNVYVALAKKELFGRVGIDMLAGPSELVVLADENADPELVALEMLAQLEHGGGSRACLITDSERLLEAVERELASRTKGGGAGLSEPCGVLVGDLLEGARLVDSLAPEHLLIDAEDPGGLLARVHNAGAVFLGADSPVALGDYAVGVNHVLPTGGAARYASPLGVYDFLKRSNVVFSNPKANRLLGPVVTTLAALEGMANHAEAVRRRMH